MLCFLSECLLTNCAMKNNHIPFQMLCFLFECLLTRAQNLMHSLLFPQILCYLLYCLLTKAHNIMLSLDVVLFVGVLVDLSTKWNAIIPVQMLHYWFECLLTKAHNSMHLLLFLQMLCYLLECLLTKAHNVQPDSPKEVIELYFVFAAIWAFGGCL